MLESIFLALTIHVVQPTLIDIICGRKPSELHSIFFNPCPKKRQRLRDHTVLGPIAIFTMEQASQQHHYCTHTYSSATCAFCLWQKQELLRSLTDLVNTYADQLPHRCNALTYSLDVLIKEVSTKTH